MKIRLLSPPGMEQCILFSHNDSHILVDPGNGASYKTMRASLGKMITKAAPKIIDLLVISNSYSNYAGGVTELVRRGYIRPRIVLISEDSIGVAYPADGNANAGIVMALNETTIYKDDISILPERCESVIRGINNHTMIAQTMENAGAKVIRYNPEKQFWKRFLSETFSEFGLEFL